MYVYVLFHIHYILYKNNFNFFISTRLLVHHNCYSQCLFLVENIRKCKKRVVLIKNISLNQSFFLKRTLILILKIFYIFIIKFNKFTIKSTLSNITNNHFVYSVKLPFKTCWNFLIVLAMIYFFNYKITFISLWFLLMLLLLLLLLTNYCCCCCCCC